MCHRAGCLKKTNKNKDRGKESDGGVKTLVSIHGDQRSLLLKGDI